MNGDAIRAWILAALVAGCVLIAALTVHAVYSLGGGQAVAVAVAARTADPAPLPSRLEEQSSSTPEPAPAPLMAEQPEQAGEEPASPEPPLRASAPAGIRSTVRAPVAQVPPAQATPQPAGGAKPEPQNLDARVALSFVGADPQADAIWFAAISDPALPAQERSDLIEDLNEDGFADPANVTAEELPLVINRLLLIEQLAPYAMDQVNADAFAEAYKDLMNMYTRLTGQ